VVRTEVTDPGRDHSHQQASQRRGETGPFQPACGRAVAGTIADLTICGIPAEVIAVAGNLTATEASKFGYVQIAAPPITVGAARRSAQILSPCRRDRQATRRCPAGLVVLLLPGLHEVSGRERTRVVGEQPCADPARARPAAREQQPRTC